MDKLDYVGLGSPFVAAYVWLTSKKNKEDIEKMEAITEEIKDEIRDLRIHLAEHYATNDSVNKKFSTLKTQIERFEDSQNTTLERIENKLDKKADK